jgi:ribosomal protein S18 acetylase RimI-like enzyme
MRCKYCKKQGIYKCSVCGGIVCSEHTRLQANCLLCTLKTKIDFIICRVKSDTEKTAIKRLVKQFWGETEQLTFDRTFDVAELPAYIAKVDDEIVGFMSFAEDNNALVIVALGVKPRYQGSGVGKSLIRKVEAEARNMGKKTMRVSTSNDDLPALAFYQSTGFRIYEIKPNAIAEKHGKILSGISGLPIRDEIRLRKAL